MVHVYEHRLPLHRSQPRSKHPLIPPLHRRLVPPRHRIRYDSRTYLPRHIPQLNIRGPYRRRLHNRLQRQNRLLRHNSNILFHRHSTQPNELSRYHQKGSETRWTLGKPWTIALWNWTVCAVDVGGDCSGH